MGIHQLSSSKKIILSLLSAVIVALVLGIFLFNLFHIQPGCAYSRYVHETDTGSYPVVEETDRYRYGIDYCDYVRDADGNIFDYFGLIQIAGWEVSNQGETWGTSMEGILLESDDHAYRVDTEMRKKTDIPYLDQSDPESKSLNVAFFTYIPQDSISTGSYRVGILVRDGKEHHALWTESMLEVQ